MSSVLEASPPAAQAPDRIASDAPMSWTHPADEQWFVIHEVDYATYSAVCDAFGERSPRMTFDGGRLIFVTISRRHGNISRVLGQIVSTIAEESDKPIRSCGSFTCRERSVERGAEPDESYYFFDERILNGDLDFDLETGPPPDLIIEADLSSSSVGRLPIFAKLGVREAWRYNGTEVLIYLLQDDRSYLLMDNSAIFPWLSRHDLAVWVQRSTSMDETKLIREFRGWVRTQLAGPAT